MHFSRLVLSGVLLFAGQASSQVPTGAVDLLPAGGARFWKRFDPVRDVAGPEVYGGPDYAPPTWRTAGGSLQSDGKSDLISRHEFANYQLHLEYQSPHAEDGLYLSGRYFVGLPDPGRDDRWHAVDVSFTHMEGDVPKVSLWPDGKPAGKEIRFPKPSPGGYTTALRVSADTDPNANKTGLGMFESADAAKQFDWNGEHFLIFARFRTTEPLGGTIVARCSSREGWSPKAKALFIRGGRVVYDIGWVGALTGKTAVDDGRWHNVVLCRRNRSVELYVDGRLEGKRRDFEGADVSGHVMKIGAASHNFAYDFRGLISEVRCYQRSVKPSDAEAFSGSGVLPGRPPEFGWKNLKLPADDGRPVLEFAAIPGIKGPIRIVSRGDRLKLRNIWIRPLDTIDHAEVVGGLAASNYENGKRIYEGLCVNCHGADGVTPSLPQSRAFGKGELKFGSDPYSLYRTLTCGNGNMAAQTWMTEQERYDVIHFIRERFMKPMRADHRPVTPQYLATLPKKLGADPSAGRARMVRDFGSALASQFERTAESALTIALGENTTASYDLHTMNLLAVWNGGFLNVDDTQHMKQRGEGVPRPDGKIIPGLGGWHWGHDGTLDYPRENLPPRGPMPARWMDYHGHYLHGPKVVLSYAIDGRKVLESPCRQRGFAAMVHSLRIGAGERELTLCLGEGGLYEEEFQGSSSLDAVHHEWAPGEGAVAGRLLAAGEDLEGKPGTFVAAAVVGEVAGLRWHADARHRLVLKIPASDEARSFAVLRFTGKGEPALQSFAGMARHFTSKQPAEVATLTKGGPTRWDKVLETRGELGSESAAYTLDTLTLPDSNPWYSWFRTSALDFFPDGRMALTTHGGDVWIVSGIDRDLKNLRWKRFASGLYEPFGVKVVDGRIYVTCKDRIVRLHDFNGDDEADFYESFSADTDVSFFFHAFNFDLQTDREGNFYYAKAGQYTDHALPGAVIKVSPDGRKREVYCTGFRTPNGMGALPDGRLTVSDNQGNWMPASKVSLVRPGGFYGYVQTHASPGNWAPDGGVIDPKKVVPPTSFDQPIIWMPQDFDNSSGGQLWVDDQRWGPLSGHLLHTSFGKGWFYYFLLQDFGDVAQSGIVKLPLDFMTGIHRARVNPKDGQVYAVGLNGWNGGGRPGLGEGGVQRVRYTGREARMLTGMGVRSGGIELTFNFPLDPKTATDPSSWTLEQWNYRWQASYGSAQWSVRSPDRQGRDVVEVAGVGLSDDGSKVFLEIPELRPVNQVFMRMALKARDGRVFNEETYLTINRVP